MRKLLLAACAAIGLATAAHAQPFPNVPPGQSATAGGLSQRSYTANSPSSGFQDSAIAIGVVGTGTAQVGSTLIVARTTHALCATGSTALQLPAVERYTPIVIMNRGTASCLIYPTTGGYLETAAGTLAAVNASFTLTAGADVTFRPVVVSGATDWLQ